MRFVERYLAIDPLSRGIHSWQRFIWHCLERAMGWMAVVVVLSSSRGGCLFLSQLSAGYSSIAIGPVHSSFSTFQFQILDTTTNVDTAGLLKPTYLCTRPVRVISSLMLMLEYPSALKSCQFGRIWDLDSYWFLHWCKNYWRQENIHSWWQRKFLSTVICTYKEKISVLSWFTRSFLIQKWII